MNLAENMVSRWCHNELLTISVEDSRPKPYNAENRMAD